eukprot:3788997-Lingulodinium_polyedra.AAC.1
MSDGREDVFDARRCLSGRLGSRASFRPFIWAVGDLGISARGRGSFDVRFSRSRVGRGAQTG